VVRDDCSNSVAPPFNKDDADVVAEFMVANAEVRDAKALGGMHTDAQSKQASFPHSLTLIPSFAGMRITVWQGHD